MRRDLFSNVAVAPAIVPAVKSASADGTTVDLAGYNRVGFAISTGAIAGDGDFGVSVEESSNGSDWATASADKVETDAPATLEANSAYRVNYRGPARYARLQLVKAGGTSIALSATAILGDPAVTPISFE